MLIFSFRLIKYRWWVPESRYIYSNVHINWYQLSSSRSRVCSHRTSSGVGSRICAYETILKCQRAGISKVRCYTGPNAHTHTYTSYNAPSSFWCIVSSSSRRLFNKPLNSFFSLRFFFSCVWFRSEALVCWSDSNRRRWILNCSNGGVSACRPDVGAHNHLADIFDNSHHA